MSSSTHKDFDFVTSSGGIDEYVLKSNGMKVLLMEDFSSPGMINLTPNLVRLTYCSVVMVMVTYLVGSRNEAIGYTGSTHLLVWSCYHSDLIIY